MNARAFAEHICRTLLSKGHQAYFVGGCVRDILLHREPADYDVATDATPERVEQIFPQQPDDRRKVRRRCSGAGSGAERSTESAAATVEVATYRSDLGYSDGRHPDQVVYSSTPQEDVQRRDFTINGLLLDPRNERGPRFRWRTRRSARRGHSRHRPARRALPAKTSCECFARCASPRDSGTR